jgi:hypothetical protein
MSSSLNKYLRAHLLHISTCLLYGLLPLPIPHAAVIGHWLFNEGSGTNALDSSGQNNHGTIFGGATYTNTPGTSGISLDGIDDFVNFGQPALFDFTSDAFSVETWIAIDGTQTGNEHGIFGKSGNSWLLGYEHGSGGSYARHHVKICGNSGCGIASQASVGSALPFGGYRHVVFVKSTFERIRIYVDGSSEHEGGAFQPIFSEAADVIAGREGSTFLECVVDEIRVHNTFLTEPEITALFAAGPDNVAPPPDHHPGRLNNLVIELLNLDPAGIGSITQFDFSHPRDGWIFVSTTVASSLGVGDSAEVYLQGPPSDTLIDHLPGEPETVEAMRWLTAGDYSLTLQTQGTATLSNLVVRAIPELAFWRYPAGTPLPRQVPVWDWPALKKHVLHSVNTMATSAAVIQEPQRSENQPYFDEWRLDGKRWLIPGLVPAYEFGPGMTTQQAYDFWISNPGYAEADWDGIFVDEFQLGEFPDSQYTQMEEALRQLTTDFPEKLFFAHVSNIMTANEPGQFMEAVVDNGGAIAWHWYEREEPDEMSAQLKLEGSLSHGMQQWRNFLSDAPAAICIGLGYFSTPPESLNENPAVDYKVWMDMQIRHLATNPKFDGLRGVLEYNSKRTDEEVLRWQGALYRHYGIEGRTNLLSDTYGFMYGLTHVDNPDFDRGTTGWTVTAAEAGSVGTGNYPGLGRLQGRVRSARGDNYLWMRRSAQAPNRAIQQIEELIPGELYTMKMFTEDRQDYLNGIVSMQTHAVQIRIDNVDIIPGRKFQEVMQSQRGREVDPPFSDTSQPWFNYYWRLFRAKGTSATLTISDWATDSGPGGPIGQELMFNFIEVQPYFAVGDEVEFSAPIIVDSNQESATGLCFTGEVGRVYGLHSADILAGPYSNTGARIEGTGGIDCPFDPNDPTGIYTGRYYQIQSIP